MIGKLLPTDDKKRKLLAVSVTVVISGLLTLWGIYGIGQYGIALFILTPIFIGAGSTILYGLNKGITKREAWLIARVTLAVFTIGLGVFAIEGLICIAMAAPFGLLLTWVGSLIGYAVLDRSPQNAPSAILSLFCIIRNPRKVRSHSISSLETVCA